jgi:hypothetical protein
MSNLVLSIASLGLYLYSNRFYASFGRRYEVALAAMFVTIHNTYTYQTVATGKQTCNENI